MWWCERWEYIPSGSNLFTVALSGWQTGGKKYDKFFIYVPTDLANDSQFRFKSGDEIEITVDVKEKRLLVEGIQQGR